MTPDLQRKGPRGSMLEMYLPALAAAIALTLATGAACVTAARAQTSDASGRALVCPDRYALIAAQPPFCFSGAGDVVLPTALYRPAAATGCRRGYERVGDLCLSPETGDVELAETPPGTQASR